MAKSFFKNKAAKLVRGKKAQRILPCLVSQSFAEHRTRFILPLEEPAINYIFTYSKHHQTSSLVRSLEF